MWLDIAAASKSSELIHFLRKKLGMTMRPNKWRQGAQKVENARSISHENIRKQSVHDFLASNRNVQVEETGGRLTAIAPMRASDQAFLQKYMQENVSEFSSAAERDRMEGREEGFGELEENFACGMCATVGASQLCSVCRIARYCSRDCQRRNWKSHKSECKKLS